MRALLTSLLLVSLTGVAAAREPDLNLAVSPDGRCRVRVVERGRGRHISYEVVTVRGSKVLHRLPSSYQFFAADDNWDWVWRQASEAEVRWSPTSRYVAVDEEVHHYMGHVLLAEVSGGHAWSIAVPEKAILARTGLRWDRYRLRAVMDEKPWRSAQRLRLSLAGQVITGTFEGDRHTYEQAAFTCILLVGHGKATVVSVE